MTLLAQPGVYLIRNTRTGKTYVGSSDDMADRCRRHLRLLRRGRHHSLKLQRSFDKHGEDAFEFKPLLICAVKDLLFFEQRALDTFNAARQGYNIAATAGAPMRGRTHTTGTKEKMSGASLGKKKAPEHAKAIGDSRRGKKMSPAFCEAATQGWKKRRLTPVSEETRKKLSEAGAGRTVSEKSRQALIARNEARTGEVRGRMTLTPTGLRARIDANTARKGSKQNPDRTEEVRKSKQDAWAARKAAGLHTRRWYANRGLPVPVENLTTNPHNDGVANPTQLTEE